MALFQFVRFFYIGMILLCCFATLASTDSDAEKDFKRIHVLMESGRESEAIVSVSDFLRRYPTHVLADDAQFALGEIYFRARDFKKAIYEFQKVVNMKNEKSDRVAETGLRIGECWKNLNDPLKARIEWEAVVRRYENTEAARNAKILLLGEKQ